MIIVVMPKKPFTFAPRAHREEVMQPGREGKHGDRHGRNHHGYLLSALRRVVRYL
jgi:hypothetical protein